jgi:hypothetical protein
MKKIILAADAVTAGLLAVGAGTGSPRRSPVARRRRARPVA